MGKKIRVRYTKKDTTFDYPSSLLSQDYSESEHDHGFLIWDIQDKHTWKKTFISTVGEEINNEYGHFTFRGKSLEDLKVFDFSSLPSKVSFRSFFEDTLTSAEKQEAIKIIREALPHASEIVPPIDTQTIVENGDSIFQNIQLISNLNSFDAQIELILSYLKKNEKMLVDEQIAEIRKIHKEQYERLSSEGKLQKDLLKGWELDRLEWNNLIQYGKDNYIDFSKIKGTVGIFGPNWIGKTSILRSLLWTIYNKIPDPHATGVHILNRHSTEARGKVILSHEDKTFTIERTMKKTSDKIKGTLDFQVSEDGTSTSKNAEVTTKTDKDSIQSRFGEIEDLLLTSLASQWGQRQMIEMKQAERKDIVNKFLGLNVYDQFYKAISPETNKIKSEVKKLMDKNLYEQIESSEKQYADHIVFVQEEKENLKKYEIKSSKKKDDIDAEKKRLDDIESKFDEEKFRNKAERYERVQSQINTETSKLNLLREQIQTGESLLEQKQAELPSLEKAEKKAINELKSLEEQLIETFGEMSLDDVIANIKADIKKLKDASSLESKIKRSQLELDKMRESGGSFTKSKELYVGNDSCVQCDFLYDCLDIPKITDTSIDDDTYHNIVNGINKGIGSLESSIEEMNKEYQSLKESIQYSEEDLDAIQVLKDNKREMKDIVIQAKNKVSKVKDIISSTESQIQNHTSSIEDKKGLIVSLKNEGTEIEAYIEENSKYVKELDQIKEIQSHIDALEEQKEEIDTKHKMLLREVNMHYDEAKKLEGKLEILRDSVKDFEEQSRRLQVYEYYTSAVHKDGVPSEIMKLALPYVNNEMKRILSTFNLEFSAEIEYNEERQEINIYVSKEADKKDQNIIEMASGAQQIITAMVMRIAFSNVSSVPSPNFFIIDEGFSALDQENIQLLPKLLEILKGHFKLVILISHLDSVKEMVENVIPISQYVKKDKDGIDRKFSRVQYP